MPKHLFRKIMPSAEQMRSNRSLGFLGEWLYDANLWHLNRRSAAGAFAVGLFMAWVPIPFQMVLAAVAALILRVNLPLSVCLVWITNPLTIPPMFYFAYWLGTAVLQTPAMGFTFELSYQWLQSSLAHIWKPLLLGSSLLAVLSAATGYLGVRLFWRFHVMRAHGRRRDGRRRRKLIPRN